MKVALVILIGLVATALANPLASVVSQIPEEFDDQEPQWALIPDGDGALHLANLNPYSFDEGYEEIEPAFKPLSHTKFLLFTRDNPKKSQEIKLGDVATLSKSNFNPTNPTRFIIHGWQNSGSSSVNKLIRTEYLNHGQYNVIVVDWGRGAQTPNYIGSRNRVGPVGEVVSKFITFLNTNTALSLNDVYIIGHSLGAHVSGNAGRLQGGRINTIVGLDPALPLFSWSSKDRVAKGDAQYVEIIHTNAGVLGFDVPLGDADFYPNGGSSQPGCLIDLTGVCAHNRVPNLYAESITTSRGFLANRCRDYLDITKDNCVSSGPPRPMGGQPSNFGTETNGVYHLTTNKKKPYAKG